MFETRFPGKLRDNSFDIRQQNIVFPERGVTLGVEILNAKKVKFTDNLFPVFGFKLVKGGNVLERSEGSGGWEKKTDSNAMLFSMNVKY